MVQRTETVDLLLAVSIPTRTEPLIVSLPLLEPELKGPIAIAPEKAEPKRPNLRD